LKAIYALDFSDADRVAVITHGLPTFATLVCERDINNSDLQLENPSNDVKLALANLARLRCLALPMTFGGGELYTYVNPTLFGERFVEACTLK
jgi:hypothetical protein